MFESSVQITVRYCETDKMGVVHHSNYLRYLEVARTKLLAELGFEYSRIESSGLYFPVIAARQKYISSLFFEDTVTVYARLKSFKGAVFVVEYRIERDGKPVHVGETEHAVTDHAMRPVNLRNFNPSLYRRLLWACGREEALGGQE